MRERLVLFVATTAREGRFAFTLAPDPVLAIEHLLAAQRAGRVLMHPVENPIGFAEANEFDRARYRHWRRYQSKEWRSDVRPS